MEKRRCFVRGDRHGMMPRIQKGDGKTPGCQRNVWKRAPEWQVEKSERLDGLQGEDGMEKKASGEKIKRR